MKKGFTLIELMVVIVILGILSAVIAPRIPYIVAKAKIGKFLAEHKDVRLQGDESEQLMHWILENKVSEFTKEEYERFKSKTSKPPSKPEEKFEVVEEPKEEVYDNGGWVCGDQTPEGNLTFMYSDKIGNTYFYKFVDKYGTAIYIYGNGIAVK